MKSDELKVGMTVYSVFIESPVAYRVDEIKYDFVILSCFDYLTPDSRPTRDIRCPFDRLGNLTTDIDKSGFFNQKTSYKRG